MSKRIAMFTGGERGSQFVAFWMTGDMVYSLEISMCCSRQAVVQSSLSLVNQVAECM